MSVALNMPRAAITSRKCHWSAGRLNAGSPTGASAALIVASSAARRVRVRKSDDTHNGTVRYWNCLNR